MSSWLCRICTPDKQTSSSQRCTMISGQQDWSCRACLCTAATTALSCHLACCQHIRLLLWLHRLLGELPHPPHAHSTHWILQWVMVYSSSSTMSGSGRRCKVHVHCMQKIMYGTQHQHKRMCLSCIAQHYPLQQRKVRSELHDCLLTSG